MRNVTKKSKQEVGFEFSQSERIFLLSERAELLRASGSYSSAERGFAGAVRGLLAARGVEGADLNADWALAEDCSRIERKVVQAAPPAPVPLRKAQTQPVQPLNGKEVGESHDSSATQVEI